MDSSDSDTSSLRLFDTSFNSQSESDISSSPIQSISSEENTNSGLLPKDEFVAVVGGLGYIGSHTCLELLRAGYNILIIDNLCNSYKTVLDQILALGEKYHEEKGKKVPLIRFCEIDYRDEAKIRELLSEYEIPRSGASSTVAAPRSRVLGVIHFAAYKSITESIEQPLKYYSNNVAGLIKFCIILSEFNIKIFIFSSSATIYGSKANSEAILREEHCVHQTETFFDQFGNLRTTEAGCTGLTNPYGRSKWMCEAVLSDIAQADEEWAITALRYFNPVGCDESGVIGEDPRGTPTNLIPVVMQVLSGQKPAVKIFGIDYPNTPDGTAVRDFIHVTDLARGHVSALVSAVKRKGFRTYNLGSGIGYSVRDVVKAIEKVSNLKVPTQVAPRREGDVEKSVALPNRAEVELNWKTEKSLHEACRDMIRFLGCWRNFKDPCHVDSENERAIMTKHSG